MKCLLCSFSNPDVDEVFQHYVNFHKIENTNYCLKALFESDNNCCIIAVFILLILIDILLSMIFFNLERIVNEFLDVVGNRF